MMTTRYSMPAGYTKITVETLMTNGDTMITEVYKLWLPHGWNLKLTQSGPEIPLSSHLTSPAPVDTFLSLELEGQALPESESGDLFKMIHPHESASGRI